MQAVIDGYKAHKAGNIQKEYKDPTQIRILTYQNECKDLFTQLEILQWGLNHTTSTGLPSPPPPWRMPHGIRIDRYNFEKGEYKLLARQDTAFKDEEEKRAWQKAQNEGITSYNMWKNKELDGSSVPNIAIFMCLYLLKYAYL